MGLTAALPTMGFVLACLCLDARGRAFADGVRGGLAMATRFDEGSAGSGSQGEWTGAWTPFGQVFTRGATTRFDLEARRRFDSLPGSLSPRPSADVAKFGFTSQPSAFTNLTASGRYGRSRDLLSAEPGDVVSPGVTEAAAVSALFQLWHGEAAFDLRSKSRAAPGAVDGWSQATRLTFLPLRTPTTGWLVSGGYQSWSLDQSEVLRVTRLTTGYRRLHTRWFSTEAEIGAAEIRESQAGGTDSRLAWSAAASGFARGLGLPFESRIRVTGDVTTTGTVELSRSLSGVSVALRGERALVAEGGDFSGPALMDFGSVAVSDTLPGGWMGALEASYGRTRLRSGPGPRIETGRGSIMVGRRIQTWLSTQTAYSYLSQDKTLAGQGERSHRGRLEIALTASFR